MNILHIINEWPAGGIQEQVYLIIKHLPKDRFKHFVLGWHITDGFFFDKYIEEGAVNLVSDEFYTSFKSIIEKYKIDIVHKQTGGGDCPKYVYQCKEMNIPLIETLHCPRYSAIPLAYVETILYTTPYTFNKNGYVYQEKMKSIQYSVDLKEPIVQFAKNKNSDPIVVGRLGRIVPDKRPDVILLLAQKSKEFFKDKIKFKIAGLAPHEEYKNWFLNEVNKLDNIEYCGFVEDKYDFWKTLDVCVNPVWETSFDIVFLEAMACGIPILTWNNSAAPYVVEDAGIVTNENISDLFKGLEELYTSSSLREELGNKGIQLIKTKYSLDNFIKEYIEVYESSFNRR